MGRPLVVGEMVVELSRELSGRVWSVSGSSLGWLNWLTRDAYMLGSVVLALLLLKSRLSLLHSLLSSPRDAWLSESFTSRSLQ